MTKKSLLIVDDSDDGAADVHAETNASINVGGDDDFVDGDER